MMTILALFLFLFTPPSVHLSVTPDHGVNPLTVSVQVDTVGPYVGKPCVAIFEGDAPVVTPVCKVEEINLKEGEVDKFNFTITSRMNGEFLFVAFLIGDEDISSNHIKVAVEGQ